MTTPPSSDPASRGRRRLRRFLSRGGREHVWSFLDLLDARPALRRALLIGVPALALIGGLGAWGYLRWARLNAVRIAQQWLDSGRLDRASEAARDALASQPNLPEPYRIAAKVAWRLGNKSAAIGYAQQAAEVGGGQQDDVLGWAEYALLGDDAASARAALARLAPSGLATARALRLRGELARRDHRLDEAIEDFRGARDADLRADRTAPAIDEVPLGIVEIQAAPPASRDQGRALLERWAPDPEWGAPALRALLADAVARADGAAASRWAEALRAHPRCTLGDIPTCLRALARFDGVGYRSALAQLEGSSGGNPTAAGQVLGWLNEIGQPADAARWGATLPAEVVRRPPAAQGMAEALRATRRWAELRDWVSACDWGSDAAFLGHAYGYAAARETGDKDGAASQLRTLEEDGRTSPAHALFVGDALVSWGYADQAAPLLWLAADRPDLALTALGTLARLYQVRRDAVGEYHAFAGLNSAQPGNRDIANNYAYFAAVTDLGSQTRILQLAKENFEREPQNVYYRATYAFVLVWVGRAGEALKVIGPVAAQWPKSPAVAFAYGAALASTGRAAEAQPVFDSLDPRTLSPQEIGWIRSALRR